MNVDKKMVLCSIIFNSRLKRYGEYIKLAKDNGYEIVSLEEFYRLPDRSLQKHFVLRHDVDHPGISTRRMFETEVALGVKSTYYFRFSTIDKKLIDEMLASGFDVGLHFETIADYIREKGLVNRDELNLTEMKERLREDIIKFEREIGHKVHSICSHGAPENTALHISNNSITEEEGIDGLGIDFEAYDSVLYNDIDCHIMDGSLVLYFGFSYRDNPITAITEGKRNIVFLSHPSHWYASFGSRIRKIGAIVLGRAKFEVSDRKFLRVAK